MRISAIFRSWVLRFKHRFLQPLYLRAIKDYNSIDGWLTPEDATGLYLLAKTVPRDATVVEIGSWKGKSTFCLARGLAEEGRLIAIDPFDASGEEGSSETYEENRGEKPLEVQFEENLVSKGVSGKVDQWKGYSQDFIDDVPEIDILFIDGDHSIEGCRFDYENYAPHVQPGGWIAFHDYRPSPPELGPTWVIENLVIPSGEFHFVGHFGSVWVGRRRR